MLKLAGAKSPRHEKLASPHAMLHARAIYDDDSAWWYAAIILTMGPSVRSDTELFKQKFHAICSCRADGVPKESARQHTAYGFTVKNHFTDCWPPIPQARLPSLQRYCVRRNVWLLPVSRHAQGTVKDSLPAEEKTAALFFLSTKLGAYHQIKQP